jgi:hypothetical protein
MDPIKIPTGSVVELRELTLVDIVEGNDMLGTARMVDQAPITVTVASVSGSTIKDTDGNTYSLVPWDSGVFYGIWSVLTP